MKKNVLAATLLVLAALFQLGVLFWAYVPYLGSDDDLAQMYSEVRRTVMPVYPLFSLIFAYALVHYNKPTTKGQPYILRPLIFWALISFNLSQILVMFFALPNILPTNKYFNAPLVRQKINRWWAIIGLVSVVICGVLFVTSMAQASAETKPFMYVFFPRLASLVPAFLVSIAEIVFCKWVTTDPYGLYTQPEEKPKSTNEDAIFRD